VQTDEPNLKAPPVRASLCENLRLVLEGLEFKRVAGGIAEEHGGLLAGLSLKADMRLDDEANAFGLQADCELMPLVPAEDEPEMGNRDIVAIDFVHRAIRCGIGALAPGREMGDNLMAMKIEVDPVRAGTAFGTTEKAPVEISRAGEIIDRESKMETWHC
jgi:hypothetical protein